MTADKAEFLADYGLTEPGLEQGHTRCLRAARAVDVFHCTGPKEVQCLDGKVRCARAPQAAGAIHTDFERGFIRAEVVSYDDYIAAQGEAGAKETGRWRLEGKDYRVNEDDVMHFRFNV